MLMSFIFSMICVIVPLLLIIIGLTLMHRSSNDREKLSPFECGFDPKKNARLPFSMRFFLLAVIFLVFDIEIVLLLPLPMNLSQNFLFPSLLLLLSFLFILLLGLFHEWNEGSLSWSS